MVKYLLEKGVNPNKYFMADYPNNITMTPLIFVSKYMQNVD